ncbi:DUF1232 domain-containing protein [Desulfosporosinus fructosivorans]|uniref:DUF1232 domain-containing protein n=1 Tax=Desulfosporosinus fructosivorans TaxID=2018669 RepID=A0A4Z0R7U5_9FIRM|nr:YkvA family protein [Desulfosporosinus fructosivorans]TGE38870.1 DUF1232 domain-containing protein [Desulfosporosinus fructosivorans]
MSNILERLKHKAKHLKAEVMALYFAYRDPRVPWYAKLLIVIVVGYALSPIDLIPDFIPVLGYLDDLVLIPLGIAMVLKMIPGPVMEEARMKESTLTTKPKNWFAAAIIIVIWTIIFGLVLLNVASWIRK